MEQIHHIHHNFPTKAGRLAGVFKKRHPSSLSKKVCSPLGPLCEGDSPQRGEMSRSDRGAWARRAPPAGGGGENCTAARNISGYGKVLSLRPFGAPPSLRCVQIHGQSFHENQHRHILLADFSAPIFHFQKNVNLRKIHEVDYTEKGAVAQGKNPSAAASLRLNASRSAKTLAIDPLISKKQITQTGPSE